MNFALYLAGAEQKHCVISIENMNGDTWVLAVALLFWVQMSWERNRCSF